MGDDEPRAPERRATGSFRQTLVAAAIAALLCLGVTGELGGARHYRYEQPSWYGESLGISIADLAEIDCSSLWRIDEGDGGPIDGRSRAFDRAVDEALDHNGCG